MFKFLHKWLLPALTWAIPMTIVSTLLGFRVEWRLMLLVFCALVIDTVIDAIYPER
jgi:hypothetical protein